MIENVRAAVIDATRLAAIVAMTGTSAWYFGLSSGEYPRFAGALLCFLVPGWWLSRLLLGDEYKESLVLRVPASFFLSYILYGWIVLSCRSLGLGYQAFFVLFALSTTAIVFFSNPPSRDKVPQRFATGEEWLLIGLAILLSTSVYAHPLSIDQGLWDFNMLESLEHQTFEPSSLDVRPFGIEEPQPRMKANLFHVFFSVLGTACDLSPRLLIYYVAPPFFGLFLLLGLSAFVQTIAGSGMPRPFALAATIVPWSLLYSGLSVYWYEFRVLNTPTLDKDFGTFFLLPMTLLFLWRYLKGDGLRWIAAAAAAIPVLVWSHPVLPIYLFIVCGGVAFVFSSRHRLGRCVAIFSCGLVALTICVVSISPSDTHPWIEELARRDLTGGKTHYWPGHYSPEGRNLASSVRYAPDGRAFLKPSQFFGSALTTYSVKLTPIWALAFLVFSLRSPLLLWLRRKRGQPTVVLLSSPREQVSSILVGAGVLLGWAAATTMMLRPSEAPLAAIIGSAVLASVGIVATAGSSWMVNTNPQRRSSSEPSGEPSDSLDDPWAFRVGEADALRMQSLYIGLLVLLYAGANFVISRDIAMYRGVERLHWLYFGFFVFAFVGAYIWAGLTALISMLAPRYGGIIRRLTIAGLYLLLSFHVADQSHALMIHRRPYLARIGIGDSAVGRLRLPWMVVESRRFQKMDAGRGARSPLERPEWLREDDVVLHLRTYPLRKYRIGRYKYAIMKQATYYRELYSEAFALQHIGEDFMADFLAYNDAIDGKITDRLIQWLRERRVSVIISINPRFALKLAQRWESPVLAIAPNTYRISSMDSDATEAN